MNATTTTNPTDAPATLGQVSPRVSVVLLGIGGGGIAVGFGLGFVFDHGMAYFLRSYLMAFSFFLSISLGALFFVALQHVTRAGWSVTVRRLAELLAGNMPVLALLFLPILLPVVFGSATLYEWNDAQTVASDHLLQSKASYLNAPFFAARCVVYFLVWWMLGRFFLQRSLEQDASGDPALTNRMESLSPLALLLYAVTVTFASFDWLMSLDPHWFSTIYGVYFFSGAAVAVFAAMILALIALQAGGRLRESLTVEHYHDLGKLLFAFVVFWGYIAFSQYMLIWYANIPEETTWYLARQKGIWKWVSIVLLFVHLLIPFFGLLSRHVKRRKMVLGFWAVWMLFAHWLDLYWLVMPGLHAETLPPPGLIDAACMIGVGAVYLAGLLRVAGNQSLVPLKDPRLEEALAFENF